MGIDSRKEKVLLSLMGKCLYIIECGGLGINKLRNVNISLLYKWLWELGDGVDKLWKR